MRVLTESPAARTRRLAATARHDTLVRNSLFIMATTLVNSLFGFTFWVVAAHLFDASALGLAAAVVSSFSLAAVLANPAVHSTLIQELPRTRAGRDWSVVVNGGILLGAVSGVVWGIALVPLLPLLSPHLVHMGGGFLAGAGIVAGVVGSTVGLIVDYLFVAERKAHLMLWRNLAFGVLRLPLLALAVAFVGGRSAPAIWGAWVATLAVTVALALTIGLHRVGRGHRLTFGGATARWRSLTGDLSWHYLTNIGALVPMYVLPLLVVVRLSDRANAYFYVTWMLCSLFFIVSPAVSSSLFAEGSHEPAAVRATASRAMRVIALLLTVMAVAYVALGRVALGVFGHTYVTEGSELLLVLVASAYPDAATNLYVSVLRVERRLRHAASLNLSMAALSLGLAWWLLPQVGIAGAGIAWLAAQSAGTLWAVVSVRFLEPRRRVPVPAIPLGSARSALEWDAVEMAEGG
jgi:O-antigen/teichoic acid export membrane protein